MISKRALFGVISLTIVGSLSVALSSKHPVVVSAAAEKIDIDYSSSQWVDHSPGEKWDIDSDLGIFEFYFLKVFLLFHIIVRLDIELNH